MPDKLTHLAVRTIPARYAHGKLVEINSHSIMSKWFAESGKLVQRLFTRVLEMVEDSSCFVVVLIDEVESLTSARAGAMNGREPTDAIRVRATSLCHPAQVHRWRPLLMMIGRAGMRTGRQCAADAARQAQEQTERARNDNVKPVVRHRCVHPHLTRTHASPNELTALAHLLRRPGLYRPRRHQAVHWPSARPSRVLDPAGVLERAHAERDRPACGTLPTLLPFLRAAADECRE